MSTIQGYTGFLPPRDSGADIRDRIASLSSELASARYADLGTALNSDFSRISHAAHEVRTYDARAGALTQAAGWGESLQAVLGSARSALSVVGEAAAVTSAAGGAGDVRLLANTAGELLHDVVSRLDGTRDGRALFGNGAVGPPGLPDPEVIVQDIRALAASSTDLASYDLLVDDYFGPGGAFETALGGLPGTPVEFPLGGGTSLAYRVDALTSEVRDVLATIAFAAGLSEAPGAQNNEGLPGIVGAKVLSAASGIARVEAQVGATEARVADYQAKLVADRSIAERDLNDATAPDPYEVATRLQEEMTRLETTYAVTARRAQMRLTDYLR
jgi:hypothetical protein